MKTCFATQMCTRCRHAMTDWTEIEVWVGNGNTLCFFKLSLFSFNKNHRKYRTAGEILAERTVSGSSYVFNSRARTIDSSRAMQWRGLAKWEGEDLCQIQQQCGEKQGRPLLWRLFRHHGKRIVEGL